MSSTVQSVKSIIRPLIKGRSPSSISRLREPSMILPQLKGLTPAWMKKAILSMITPSKSALEQAEGQIERKECATDVFCLCLC